MMFLMKASKCLLKDVRKYVIEKFFSFCEHLLEETQKLTSKKAQDLLEEEVIFTLLFQNIDSNKNEMDVHWFMF